ncbi:hypothetical protein SKAU_G00299430 [Synaphobranchus kaupii]|uniref:Interleukin-2 receptor subunit beta N-terminal domain-containing protein n=1 Tax=Synaphobranchus kaupii TaxID=118154 RepID=A0A9Q1EVD6_SYNKA|nr:hypothetical protein SKAU_G00299430 [Synaphobranchus kaupii]
MEVPWPLSLLLLLTVHTTPGRSLQDLTCFNDYVKNISCTWNSSEKPPEEPCVLQEKQGHGKSCDLTPVEGQGHDFRTCQLVFKKVSGYYYNVTIYVVCGGSVVATLKEYRPALNVKMHPPGKPVIAKSNVSWSLGTPHSNSIYSYYFQLQFKRSEQPWQNAMSRNLTAKEMSVEVAEDRLEMGRLYEARVRVKPSESQAISLKGVWSSWSPTASWRSEVGRPPEREKPRSGPELQLSLGLAVAVVALLVLISWKYNRDGWVYRLKLPHVPNPSTYFHALNSVHGGNFQKWLSPIFAPESFEVPQSFEDISAVEVCKAKDVTALLHGECASEPTELWDSSAVSSCFSNMGYFYSKYPDSYEIEVCPVYFSYQTEAGRSEEERGGDGVDPLPSSSSYELLRDLPGESKQMDSGRREWEVEVEVEEGEEEGEIEYGPKEMDTLPSPSILPFSLPGHVTPSPIPLPPHLPSISLPPLPFRDFDTDTAPASSNASGPLEGTLGRSASERIEPSSGGYMSVMEMMNTYGNKSI